jgi:hypothetical protein
MIIKLPSKSKVKNKSVLPSEFGSITICALRYAQTVVNCIEKVAFVIEATKHKLKRLNIIGIFCQTKIALLSIEI